MSSYISQRYPSASSIAKRPNNYQSGRYGGSGEGVNLLEGTELAYRIAHDTARRRLWCEHIEYSVEYGPQPPHPQPSTTDKNGDELKRGDLVWFHNQHARWGRRRSSYTGYVLSTFKGHVQITGGSGSWVIPTCDVWLYHSPKREADLAVTPDAEEAPSGSAPVEQPEASAKRRKSVHRLPPAPEGCRWENRCSWIKDEEKVRYILILKSHDEVLGDVQKDWRADHGWNWYSNPTQWKGTGATLYRAAKELGSNVAEALEKERNSAG